MATRDHLKAKFRNGACPDEKAYADIFESSINFLDDGLERPGADSPLVISARGSKELALKLEGGLYLSTKPNATTPALKINNAEGGATFFIIDKDGNIGVGTGNPSTKLHVAGNLGVSKMTETHVPQIMGDTTRGLQISAIPSGYIKGPRIVLRPNNYDPDSHGEKGRMYFLFGDEQIEEDQIPETALMSFQFRFKKNGTSIHRELLKLGKNTISIAPVDGNVGIGTTNPQRRLHVNGGGVAIEDRAGDFESRLLLQHTYIVTDFPDVGFEFAWADSHWNKYKSALILNSSGEAYFIGGKVGFGKTNPQKEIDVHGCIKADELVVSNNGNGYSFKIQNGILHGAFNTVPLERQLIDRIMIWGLAGDSQLIYESSRSNEVVMKEVYSLNINLPPPQQGAKNRKYRVLAHYSDDFQLSNNTHIISCTIFGDQSSKTEFALPKSKATNSAGSYFRGVSEFVILPNYENAPYHIFSIRSSETESGKKGVFYFIEFQVWDFFVDS